MKTRFLSFVILLSASAWAMAEPMMAVYLKDSTEIYKTAEIDSLTFFDDAITLADCKKCYKDNPYKKTITFIFDSLLWRKKNPTNIEIRGSFNDWGKEKKFYLTKNDTATVRPMWIATLSYADVKFPGNSGQPEYKFVINGDWQEPPTWLTSGYKFSGTSNNQIIVYSTDNLADIKAKNKIASTKKTLSQFDLTTQQGREDISNVRIVPGTTSLIRCYHPFKYTTSDRNTTEFERVKQVGLFLEEYEVKSDICLSEDDTKNLKTVSIGGQSKTETIPEYYQNIIDAGKVLYVGYPSATNYYDCYRYPKSQKVGNWVKEIIDFIADNTTEAPYSIHCRLGTDRTGFFCGIIAAMCGASLDEIIADYQRSNNMYIKEYRDAKMIKIAFDGLLDVDDAYDIEDLKSAVTNYFINNGYTTSEKVETLLLKLGAQKQ